MRCRSNRTLLTLLSLLTTAALVAGTASTPLQAATLVIEDGTLHPISGPAFIGTLLIEDGKIQAVGSELPIPEGATKIDATGLHVYPGMFDAMSQLGLVEIGSVQATNDSSEMGVYNPQLRSTTAVHPATELVPVTRANGLTHALIVPGIDNDGVIAGQAAVLDLDGWTVEEMTVRPDVAMVLYWPEIQTRSFDFATFSVRETPFNEAEEKAKEQQQELREWLRAARHYGQASAAGSQRLERDLKLEALAEALSSGRPVIIVADRKGDIEAAVEFAEQEELTMILAGGREAWKVKELLAEKEIPVILGRVQSLPRNEDDSYARPFRGAGELVEAGVKIAFGSSAGGGFGPGGAHSARTLPYEAATACAFGLSREEALKALTLNPAQIFGLDDRLGTLEAGKIANLMITDGDPLEIQTHVLHVVIEGHEVSTDNRHRRLYERYRGR